MWNVLNSIIHQNAWNAIIIKKRKPTDIEMVLIHWTHNSDSVLTATMLSLRSFGMGGSLGSISYFSSRALNCSEFSLKQSVEMLAMSSGQLCRIKHCSLMKRKEMLQGFSLRNKSIFCKIQRKQTAVITFGDVSRMAAWESLAR